MTELVQYLCAVMFISNACELSLCDEEVKSKLAIAMESIAKLERSWRRRASATR